MYLLANLQESVFGEFDEVQFHKIVELARGFDEAVGSRGSRARYVADWRSYTYSSIHETSPGTVAKECIASGCSFISVKLWG